MFEFAYPAEIWTYITARVILMLAGAFSIRKIWQGSKSAFAYALLAFIFLEGFKFFIRFFIPIIRHLILLKEKLIMLLIFMPMKQLAFATT